MATIRRAVAAERQRQALAFRIAGLSFEAIAEKLEYKNRSCAFYAVDSALKAMVSEPAEAVRQLELARLDAMHAGLWEQARTGDTYAVDRALKIAQRRSDLLGLDAPKKIAPTSPDGTTSVPMIGYIEVVRPDGDPIP